jgi:cobalt-zinc-cadmium efflux system outer membrane protein
VKSAQTYYTTGKIPFLSLIEAERNVIDLRDRSYDATADAFRRRAALELAVGGPLPTANAPKP